MVSASAVTSTTTSPSMPLAEPVPVTFPAAELAVWLLEAPQDASDSSMAPASTAVLMRCRIPFFFMVFLLRDLRVGWGGRFVMDFTSEIITQLSQFLKFIFLIKRIVCVHGLWYTGTGKYTQQGGICMDFKDLEYFAAIAGAATSPARPSSSTSASLPFPSFCKNWKGTPALCCSSGRGGGWS